MNDLSPSLRQRRFDLDAWYIHCSVIIRSELERHGVSVRALFGAGVLKSRNGFGARLKSATLRPKEMGDLADYLEIDLVHLMTAFLTSEPDQSYNNSVFENISLIYRALVVQCDKLGMDILRDMDLLRPAVATVVATKVIELLRAHHERCEQARDVLILA